MQFLFRPIPIYPLVFFRIAFGLLMVLEALGALGTGWVKMYYLDPEIHFSYIGLEFIKPLPGNGMVYVYLAQAVVALGILLGWRYRLSAAVFFLLFGYSFWCEKTHYLNHHYLVWLVSGLMVFLPAHRWLSLDAKRNPETATRQMAFWPLFLLRVQLVIVYFYAGLAKLQPDWLAGKPLRIWFAAKADYPIIGPWLPTEPVIMFTAWGGLIFDLLVAWGLLYKPTRWFAFVVAAVFHVFNAAVFQVGVFPWFMLLASLLFFEPEQIGRWFFGKRAIPAGLQEQNAAVAGTNWPAVTKTLLPAYLVFQALFPFRHWLVPGDVNWTEEGHRYSWRMMLRAKSGYVHYQIRDPETGQTFTEYPNAHLTPSQQTDVASRPDMTWQYAQFLKEKYRQRGVENVQVFAYSSLSINGYPPQPLVDSSADLASIPYQLIGHKEWVTQRVR